MSRRFVVDGHNAIHRLRLAGGPIEALRDRLVALVRAAAPRGAAVFFDGHPAPGAFGGTEAGGVTVRYAGDREADDAIVEHVRHARHPERIVVVTDDLGLARRCGQLGAESIRVAQFLAATEAPEPPEKAGGGSFTPADFGLPEVVDLDAPPPGLAPPAGPARPMRRASHRGGHPRRL